MLKLTKKQIEEKQKILDNLTDMKAKADEAIDNLNLAREAAKEFAADLVNAMDEHYDSKTEKWQEGDNGSSYAAWKEEWDELASALDEDVSALDDIQVTIEAFDSAPEEPAG